MKLVVLSALAAVALASAGCGGGNEGSDAAFSGEVGTNALSAAVQSPPPAGVAVNGITVVGTGTADVVPDVAEWSFGVRSRGGTASEALAANAATMKKIVEALRNAGVGKEDLRTQEVSVYPETTDDGRTVTGYSASSTVAATVRNLDAAGKTIDAAVSAGANDVYGPNLRPSDTDAPYRAAVDAAFDDARSHAEAIAAKAGVSLGAPVAIAEGGGSVPGPVLYDRAAGAEVAPVEPGTQQVSATLTITFAIVGA
ncbi:MAG TPA: SIMPL domain-containing protein [Gaiellaceae bacterium]|nr:SIMPL domain-containing protein [Gaiellaceae bacterium]